MKAKRRLEIIMETHETTIIRFRPGQTVIFCEACRTASAHLSVARAAELLSLPESEIARLAETEEVHSTETADRVRLLCGNSLAALSQNRLR